MDVADAVACFPGKGGGGRGSGEEYGGAGMAQSGYGKGPCRAVLCNTGLLYGGRGSAAHGQQ
ncbi:hypothetical protein [Streptomyces sp. NPDC002785]|uniref:hypothetical protein n=1 Tax=Streptomyces sp. NPDC002785 TaxID=3154543 RepID=UPI003319B1A2